MLIRHGQSAGNVARDVAYANEALAIDIGGRDCDVPLSPLGTQQAAALGRALVSDRTAPDVVLVSPYLRAQQTASLLLAAAGWSPPIVTDERLREKEFGVLDGLTRWGIASKFPDEVLARERLGKFYYRAPGGESWVDVILRLRSVWETMRHDYTGARITIVAHQVIVLCFRYIVEEMNEAQLLAVDRASDVANCSVTRYLPRGDKLQLETYNSVEPLVAECAPVTSAPDIAPRTSLVRHDRDDRGGTSTRSV